MSEDLVALKADLKNAFAHARDGRWEEFFQSYVGLFNSSHFGKCRPDDQRQAAKLLVTHKTLPKDPTEASVAAFQAAWQALSKLTEATNDARDFELLGLTHLRLADETGARTVFQLGLDTAKAANDSDMCGVFLRHLSTL